MHPKLSGGIDHVHVYVADRDAAAAWYARVLGFSVIEEFRAWAEHPGGPLTIADASGKVHLALFATDKPRHDAVALGVTAAEFLQWIAHLESCGLTVRVADHDMAFSAYFADPDGNGLELTTYETEPVRAARR
ncbi:MAG: VOC family protein [Planctomycetes bacterium]|nr:VOC family protein [Planctomycetota bacterium]